MSQIEMPRYQSHKVVHAVKIAGLEILESGDALIAPDHPRLRTFRTREGWAERFAGDETDLGYYVIYPDGFSSWSPTKAFEEGYLQISGSSGMDFGRALNALRSGEKLRRAGWNGKGQFVVMMPGLYLPPYNTQEPGAKVNDRTAKHIGKDVPLDSQPYFALFNAQGKWQPGWLASQADLLANDWEVVD